LLAGICRTLVINFLAESGTKFARKVYSMNVLDTIILYLAIGMPFGVQHYLKNRFPKSSLLKSLTVVVLWIPYAIKLFQKGINKKLRNVEFDEKLFLVSKYQKNLEIILFPVNSGSLLFEFREVIERYIALTLNSKVVVSNMSDNKREIFRVSNNPNLELSSVCLNRLNQQKLKHHQSNARKDFVNLVNLIPVNGSVMSQINSNIRLIAKDLDDFKLIEAFNETSRISVAIPKQFSKTSEFIAESVTR
jgi:hypothetical protein